MARENFPHGGSGTLGSMACTSLRSQPSVPTPSPSRPWPIVYLMPAATPFLFMGARHRRLDE